MKGFILFITFTTSLICQAQVISQFTWNALPTTAADVGPDATSVSSSATCSSGGAGSTWGLNAGTPKANLNFIIPTSSGVFDVNGIDISIDYQRDESVGNFIDRGSSLILKSGNNFAVTYRVDDGAGGYTTVSSGNIYSIPNDNTFRTYRFLYLPSTGLGELFVDGVSQWSDDGPDNRNLYWTGAGDITVGKNMDGSGSDRAFFDNLIIQEAEGTSGSLPIELGYFGATELQNQTVKVEWTTISEINNDYFTVERSRDGQNWDVVNKQGGAGNSMETLNYSYSDIASLSGVSYYRLKQTDFDGEYSYSNIVVVKRKQGSDLQYYPNPVNEALTVYNKNNTVSEFSILSSSGRVLLTKYFNGEANKIKVDMLAFPPGLYYLKTQFGVSVILKK